MNNPTACKFRFVGEVVETQESENQNFAKLSLKYICVEIPSEEFKEIKLGDRIVLETHLQPEMIFHMSACGLSYSN